MHNRRANRRLEKFCYGCRSWVVRIGDERASVVEHDCNPEYREQIHGKRPTLEGVIEPAIPGMHTWLTASHNCEGFRLRGP